MLKLLSAILLSFIPGIFGALWTPGGGIDGWYNTLVKTPLTPDGWVFGVVWPILYLLLGIALYLAIRNKQKNKIINPGTILFLIHIFLNGLWSFVFFGQHLIILGAINILVLIFVACMMQKKFAAENKYAGLLIWPYILWLMFALYLNIGIYLLN
ncbi:MAG: tryptophan-rich sensory protein [Alphaproteobacteria bacterium]|nr:tryptophan-rich sensory protein [Alphaproteobacteria bacterium]MBN2675009.1 tryptophan-rich sensory protein [Alphaproteobacteria bacterium]